MNCVNIPTVSVCIKVCADLSVLIFVDGKKESNSKLSWVLGRSTQLQRWSQLENLLSHYRARVDSVVESDSATDTVSELCDCVRTACDALSSHVDRLSDLKSDDDVIDTVNLPCIAFCVEQLKLAVAKPSRRRYSTDMLRFAFTLLTRSSTCYRIMQNSSSVVLPNVRYLRKLTSVLRFTPGMQPSDHEQMRYLQLKCERLTEREKFVVLQLDEMHVNPSYAYKGGSIVGVACNSESEAEQANSVQAFLISSLGGGMKEVVALVPVKQLNANDLATMIRKVISVVQKCGFVVTVVISDNNQMNAKAFEALARGSDMTAGIPNPDLPQYKFFFASTQFTF
jgi:hypothetical protein